MKSKKLILISISSVIVLASLVCYLILTRKNIHLVRSDGQKPTIYRSAQLKPEDFEKLVKEKGIDLVLNLRGESDDPHYLKEKAVAEELGVEYHAYGFSVYRTPSKERFLKILDLLDKTKNENKTLLIHCRAGADRTGLISALAQHQLYGFPIEEARQDSLSWKYGHLKKSNSLLEHLIEDYKSYAAQGNNFRSWVVNKYNRQKLMNELAYRK